MRGKNFREIGCLLVLCLMILAGCSVGDNDKWHKSREEHGQETGSFMELPELRAEDYDGEAYVELNNNKPDFEESDCTTEAFEEYSSLDKLGRCGEAYANICREIMPTEKRGAIGMVKPSGWHTVKYQGVDGKYLYNRCHLIGYQLAGENANERNLITGTRYLNVEGMLPFEDLVADYVRDTGNHVLYRVTPIYEGDNLVAEGVRMEGYSVEDKGEGISFHVFVYNVQPGIEIDYSDGDSAIAGNSVQESSPDVNQKTEIFIVNKNTGKFHLPECSSAKKTLPKNRKIYEGSREELIEQGYTPCDRCKP